jgi:release factor glutamine methyltransferase
LLAHFLKKDRAFLFSHSEQILNYKIIKQFQNATAKIQNGIPLAYVIKTWEFYGLDFYVDQNVLIPRSETEILVEKILKYFKKYKKITITDIGTGSGCIAITIASKLKEIKLEAKIYATDISKNVLKIAKINAIKHKVQKYITFLQGNLLDPLPEKMDIIIANLPYLDLEKLKKQFPKIYKNLEMEPKIALAGGTSGFDLIKKLLISSPKFLKPKGAIFLEIDPCQKKLLQEFIKNKLPDFKFQFFKNYQNKNRFLIIFANPKFKAQSSNKC